MALILAERLSDTQRDPHDRTNRHRLETGRGGGGLSRIEELTLWKPAKNRLSAVNLNTGRHAWSVPVGEAPEVIRNHPLLAGLPDPETGGAGYSVQMVMGHLLVQSRSHSEGEQQILPGAPVMLNALDKWTGEIMVSVELPAPAQYGMMTYLHAGRQHVVVQVGSRHTDGPGSLVALTLP